MSARERLAAQDAQLERLGAGVDRIRNLGETMHDETRQQLGLISASRGAAAPSRRRRASSLGEEVGGGLFFDF